VGGRERRRRDVRRNKQRARIPETYLEEIFSRIDMINEVNEEAEREEKERGSERGRGTTLTKQTTCIGERQRIWREQREGHSHSQELERAGRDRERERESHSQKETIARTSERREEGVGWGKSPTK
jgi:hypothetical protein